MALVTMPSPVSEPLPIRAAATVVLVRRETGRPPRVLMGQRGAVAAFMPSKYVFPGGAVDQGDAASPFDLGQECAARLRLLCPADAPSPEVIAAAARRELHEETGLLLREDRPDALRFVFRAITPPGRSRRFDARFFLADAAHILNDPDDFSAAEDELSHLHWIALAEARSLDLPFITEVVLAEVSALLAGQPDLGVPFFDNSTGQPRFRRLTTA
jgi:8-oxo-dGTP pyrophosphatase MutT (NUDIX family)